MQNVDKILTKQLSKDLQKLGLELYEPPKVGLDFKLKYDIAGTPSINIDDFFKVLLANWKPKPS